MMLAALVLVVFYIFYVLLAWVLTAMWRRRATESRIEIYRASDDRYSSIWRNWLPVIAHHWFPDWYDISNKKWARKGTVILVKYIGETPVSFIVGYPAWKRQVAGFQQNKPTWHIWLCATLPRQLRKGHLSDLFKAFKRIKPKETGRLSMCTFPKKWVDMYRWATKNGFVLTSVGFVEEPEKKYLEAPSD